MCGITGYFGLNGSFDANRFAMANDSISYRGPDDSGYLTIDTQGVVQEHNDDSIRGATQGSTVSGALGFRRLAIIDLTQAGHQPMSDKTRRFWIVFNGEVYNYLELRSELQSQGLQFSSDSDTEVILSAYLHWGAECLDRFNGMWSFCILDAQEQTLFCARDRFGIKPFNFYLDDSRFIFGSEVKQVVTILDKAPKTDYSTLTDFLIFGVKNHSDKTFRKDIKELRGGQCMSVDLNKNNKIVATVRTWWDLTPEVYSGTEDQAIEKLLELLKDSVRIRLRSDVATGTALSGGLDSTGLVSLIDELTTTQQNVFTVISQDKDLDELAFANETIEQYGLCSFKTEFGVQSIEELERITFHHDQPVNSASMFGGWILQKLVKDSGVIVNIMGQGADELMGGYSRPPHALPYLDAIAKFKFIHAHQNLFAGYRNSAKNVTTHSRVLVEDIAKYLLRAPTYRAVMKSRGKLLNPEIISRYAPESAFLHVQHDAGRFHSIQKRQAYAELKYRNLPSLLHNADRDSMAHSIEARLPFLDYRVAEFIFSLPSEMLTKKGFTKYSYRKAMTGRIKPKILWDNNKKGFATPTNDYLSIGKEYFSDLLSDIKDHPAIDMTGLKSITPNSKLYGTPLHWRLLCTLIWEKANATV